MKKLLTGNEALARGVWESGCHVSSAYPGTPSTEIQEQIGTYPDLYAEWAPNEKVALEVAAGAAMGGARAFASMKHVGLNVAADPLFTVAYTGVTGSLVINTSDEPGMHSSQNEQDNRLYAQHAKIPLICPSDSQECLDYVKKAFSLSERYDTPVLFRTTTRISHSKSIVTVSDRSAVAVKPYSKNIEKNLMIPAFARNKHPQVEERLRQLAQAAETSSLNRIERGEKNDGKIGIITEGISYQYVREVFGSSADILKLGFLFPFPEKLLREFSESVDTLYIVEENEPFIEDACRRLGIACRGKELLPICGELSPEILRRALKTGSQTPPPQERSEALPSRPPTLCAGCPHRGIFTALARYRKHVVSTDIGCYTLGALPPLDSGDFLFCMGSSISSGMGFVRALEQAAAESGDQKTGEKVIAVIGDSTFFHSGITGLINVVYSSTPIVVIILDNRITAMTGHQQNPGTGMTLQGKSAPEIDIRGLVESLGIEPDAVAQINPHDVAACRKALADAVQAEGPRVIITKAPCALLPEVRKAAVGRYYRVDRDTCITCKACIRTGCPAISIRDGKSSIDPDACAACGVCMAVCRPGAISGPHVLEEGGKR